MSQLDVANAKRALAARLAAWGVTDDPTDKASGFIEDLLSIGWQMNPSKETRIRPPRKDEECKKHPGQWAVACGGCRADEKAASYDDEPGNEIPSAATPADACRIAAGLPPKHQPEEAQ